FVVQYQEPMPQAAYLHIPFCAHHCDFCDFAVAVGLDDRMETYCQVISREIEERTSGRPASQLQSAFYGGGTPGYLPAHLLAAIHHSLVKACGMSAHAEITLETTPETVSVKSARAWLELGINRLSIGVEALDAGELTAMGRRGSRRQAFAAIEAAGEAGFTNISCDLMYGLPEQTLDSWQATLRDLLATPIQHLSAYGLTIAVKSPLLIRYPRESDSYPDEVLHERMYARLVASAEEAGFAQYEISNFSRPGYESRHNLVYWNNDEYFGFGVSAHRYIDRVRSSNFRSFARYMLSCLENESEEAIDDQTRLKEAIFLALRTRSGIDLTAFASRYGVDLLSVYEQTVDKLMAGGFIDLSAGALRLTQKGVLVSNLVMSEFM